MKRIYVSIRKASAISLLLCLVLMSACSTADGQSGEIPENILDFYESYLELGKTGMSNTVDMCFWPEGSELNKTLFSESPQIVTDYEIVEAEKINNSLYGFIILLSDNTLEGKYQWVCNFVGEIDGKLCVIRNQNNIPSELKAGFDSEKYSYDKVQERETDKEVETFVEVDTSDIIGLEETLP